MTKDHIIYYHRHENDYTLKVYCLNPREIFSTYLENAKSSIFFSATLHPFDYFCDILAFKQNDNKLSVFSPFNKEKFGLYIYSGINTYYQYREKSYEPLADLISSICNLKKGNYIVYFPSFSFLMSVHKIIKTVNPDLNVVMQKSSMAEHERENFLKQFDKTDETLIAFAVLGGIFGEGIDLIGDKLIGVMVITVGLPSLGNEQDLIKDYYNDKNHMGFEYAYRFPGFNKVMQAAGRVIRTEEDKGFVILIDPRFAKQEYKELYPPDWKHYKVFGKKELIMEEVERFWDNEQ